ncbi:proprotein convertase P-domain-containing protein [Blastopirellula marina]|uniref:Calcium sensor EFh n=1 Tax=Blastopirellula marina TaxID=124 RepID=A0A2S8GBP4_9BACT|nr:proprotein convertase P-domain-containing protein [Blastopirellula marina]PQO41878.1 calcium sensor EFh [Blastopirellula marina]PTL46236.1 calcium sensor EFh [Blastopirellula marina]
MRHALVRNNRLREQTLIVTSVGLLLLLPSIVCAQAEWIRRFDDDRNGYIEPDEISDRGRRFLEEIAVPYGISLSRPNSVEKLEQAARLHAQRRNRGAATPARTPGADEPSMKGFGIEPEQKLIPSFGIGEVKYDYIQADVDEAEATMRRWDRNRDGKLDAEEIVNSHWDGRDPSTSDLNNDRELSLPELIQRYARRRIANKRTVTSLGSIGDAGSRSSDQRNDWQALSGAGASRNGDRGSDSLAKSIVDRYDFNRNDQLEPQEMSAAGIEVAKVDYNRDGAVDSQELSQYLFNTMEKAANSRQEAIPTWFFERDANGDQQVLMSEFTDQWDEAALSQFASYDHNQDGMITIDEVLSLDTVAGGAYSNKQAEVLLPRTTIVSEIEVAEDYLIGDLNVQLSITHTYVEQLDGYLIGPDGQRIELFTGVGGSDDHFDKTIFDDDSGERITRSRPPFRGSFQPEALEKRQPGLNYFRGKNLKGTWQLMIRASRSERSGVLHGWSLIVKPSQEAIDDPNAAQEQLKAADEAAAAKVESGEAAPELPPDGPRGEGPPRGSPGDRRDFRRRFGPR